MQRECGMTHIAGTCGATRPLRRSGPQIRSQGGNGEHDPIDHGEWLQRIPRTTRRQTGGKDVERGKGIVPSNAVFQAIYQRCVEFRRPKGRQGSSPMGGERREWVLR